MAGRLPPIIGEAAQSPVAQEKEKPPIDFDHIDGERFLADKHTVKLSYGSSTTLSALKPDGKPSRLFWDVTKKIGAPVGQAEHGFTTFKLTAHPLPSLEDKLKKKPLGWQTSPTAGSGPDGVLMASSASAPSLGASVVSNASLKTGIGADGKPLKRADRYFQLLMKAHNKREEELRKEAEQEEWARCEGAAKVAFDKILAAENPPAEKPTTDLSASESDSDEDDSEEGEGDFGDLTEYDGQMKIEIDLIILKAPGQEEEESVYGSEHEGSSGGTPGGGSSKSSESTPPIDFSEELEALKAEMKATEPEKEGGEGDGKDEMPEGLRGIKKMPNMWDNPFPEWTLDVGGSVFFVPAAERYAFAPSLPPPPPPSIHGRRRIHLKPRLPLDISNHRYKDEHPNIWPASHFSPELEHYQSFEKKMMTFDLYRASCEGLSRLPQQTRAKDTGKHQWRFGKYVEKRLARSQAWKNWRNRERAKRAEEEAQKQAEAQAAMERQLQKEAKLKELEEKLAKGEEEAD